MTDMLHKPNGWNEPLNQMTEEEWQEYFRLREDLDVEYSEEELDEALLKINQLLKNKNEALRAYLWKHEDPDLNS